MYAMITYTASSYITSSCASEARSLGSTGSAERLPRMVPWKGPKLDKLSMHGYQIFSNCSERFLWPISFESHLLRQQPNILEYSHVRVPKSKHFPQSKLHFSRNLGQAEKTWEKYRYWEKREKYRFWRKRRKSTGGRKRGKIPLLEEKEEKYR